MLRHFFVLKLRCYHSQLGFNCLCSEKIVSWNKLCRFVIKKEEEPIKVKRFIESVFFNCFVNRLFVYGFVFVGWLSIHAINLFYMQECMCDLPRFKIANVKCSGQLLQMICVINWRSSTAESIAPSDIFKLKVKLFSSVYFNFVYDDFTIAILPKKPRWRIPWRNCTIRLLLQSR